MSTCKNNLLVLLKNFDAEVIAVGSYCAFCEATPILSMISATWSQGLVAFAVFPDANIVLRGLNLCLSESKPGLPFAPSRITYPYWSGLSSLSKLNLNSIF